MWKATADGITFAVKVIPNAQHNEIVGWENGELKVRIAAVPDQGKANDALIHFLADTLHIRKSRVTILQGQSSRHKRLHVAGLQELSLVFHRE